MKCVLNYPHFIGDKTNDQIVWNIRTLLGLRTYYGHLTPHYLYQWLGGNRMADTFFGTDFRKHVKSST